MPAPKILLTAAYSLILAAIFTTTVAQSPAHSPSPATRPAPFAPAPFMMPVPPSMGGAPPPFMTPVPPSMGGAPPPFMMPVPPSMGGAPPPFMMPEPPSMGGGAPAPGLDCMPYLYNMSDCLGYVMTGSNDTKPNHMCCQELGNLVDMQPVCLCQLLGNPDKSPFPIDISKALKLPAVCNVTTPPVSLCADLGYPVPGLGPSGSPATAPSPAGTLSLPTASPSPSESPSDSSLTASPSPGVTGDENNGASNLFISNLNFLIGLAFIVVLPYFF